MRTNLVGLDIGSSSVRAVEMRLGRRGKPEILHSYEIPLPDCAVVRGEILDADSVIEALKQLWTKGGFKGKNVVIGAGNHSVIVREFKLPKVPLKHIRESLPFQAQSILQLPLDETLLDFYPTSESVGEKGPVINGLLIAAEKKRILENIKVVEGIGLRVAEVELIPFALNRILINRQGITGTVALIDIGATTTSIVVSTNGEPSFVRIISAGGNDATKALQGGLEIGLEAAEALKRSLGYQIEGRRDSGFDSNQIQGTGAISIWESALATDLRPREILRTVTDELLGGLRNTVNYFNNSRPKDPIMQLILTGGGSQLRGIAATLGQITNLPIKTVDPLSSFTLPHKKNAKEFIIGDAMTVSLGLALRNAS